MGAFMDVFILIGIAAFTAMLVTAIVVVGDRGNVAWRPMGDVQSMREHLPPVPPHDMEFPRLLWGRRCRARSRLGGHRCSLIRSHDGNVHFAAAPGALAHYFSTATRKPLRASTAWEARVEVDYPNIAAQERHVKVLVKRDLLLPGLDLVCAGSVVDLTRDEIDRWGILRRGYGELVPNHVPRAQPQREEDVEEHAARVRELEMMAERWRQARRYRR